MVVQIETRRFATAAIPPKDQPPLPVDADRMETREIAAQLLEMIAGRHAQALVGRRVVDHLELPKETAFEIGRMFRGSGGGPIFGLQSRHTSELPGVRRYKHRAPAACLGGDQEIVRPDRRSRPPQLGAKLSRLLGVFRLERQHRDRRLQEDREAVRVFLAPGAVGDAVLQLEQDDGGERQRALPKRAREPFEKMYGLLLQDRDDDIRVDTDHLSNETSSCGIEGCSRPSSMNGTSL